jgi:hypothetical protein
MTTIDSFFGKSHGGCSQTHLQLLLGQEPEGPLSKGDGVEVSWDFGGFGLELIVGGHQPSYAEVAPAAGKPSLPLGKGKKFKAFELMGKAQYALEADFTDQGSVVSPIRVA